MEIRPLYGGAIQAFLPTTFLDVSDMRPVPDHQEVHIDPANDSCVIVELLDMDTEHGDGEGAIRHQFDELSSHNESHSTILLGNQVLTLPPAFIPSLDGRVERYAVIGIQNIQKHRSANAPVDLVIIMMVLLRIPHITTDVVITLNIPVPPEVLATQGQVFHDAIHALTPNILLPGDNVTESFASLLQYLPQIQVFRTFLDSFKIVDWGLFR